MIDSLTCYKKNDIIYINQPVRGGIQMKKALFSIALAGTIMLTSCGSPKNAVNYIAVLFAEKVTLSSIY